MAAATATASFAWPSIARSTESRAEKRRRTKLNNDTVLGELFDPGVPLHPWKWIVVHHTAKRSGSLAGIDRYHRNHFGDPLGAEYHFVINNGRKLPAGWIEVARWRYQEPAWHLFKPELAPDGIAICLVGNFEEQRVPGAQLESLVTLTTTLMDALAIDAEHVTTHRGVDGRLTQCPGKNFPREDFIARLREHEARRVERLSTAPSEQATLFGRSSLRCFP